MTFCFDSLPSLLTILRSACCSARWRCTAWLTSPLAHEPPFAPLMMLDSACHSAVDTPICPLPILLLAICSARVAALRVSNHSPLIVFAQKKRQIVAAVDKGRCSATPKVSNNSLPIGLANCCITRVIPAAHCAGHEVAKECHRKGVFCFFFFLLFLLFFFWFVSLNIH
jgi:hypothetical protein